MRTLCILFLLSAAAATSGCSFTDSLFELPQSSADQLELAELSETEDEAAARESTAPTNVLSSYQEGKAHFQSGRYGLALDAFREALAEEEPPTVRTLNAVGACYDQLRSYDLAIRYYEAALTLNPDAAQTLNNLAYSYILRSEWVRDERYLGQAQTYLVRAAELAPDNAVVLGNRQLLAEKRGIHEGVRIAAHVPVRPVETSFLSPHRDPYTGWIERVRGGNYFLVTQPSDALSDSLRRTRIDPAIASISHAGQ